eukprot:gene1474-1816_t
MRLKVVTAHSGSNPTTRETLDICCGQGQQILRWLGYAACAQLSYRRGESLGRYVPQAVCKDNTVLDVDMVLSEVAADGDELLVEYSDGPMAFKASHRYQDLVRTTNYAPDDAPRALQMLFLLYTCEAAAAIESIHRMTLPQFKALLQAAKVTSSSLPPDKLDQLFSSVQTSPGGLHRFVAESFATGATGTLLSTKLLSLLQDCIFAHLFPELQRRVDKFRSAVTPAAQVLLRKGRRLTEQVLERCQVRRVQSSGPLCVDVRYVAKHLLQASTWLFGQLFERRLV